MNQIYYESAVAGFFTLLFFADLIKRQLSTKRNITFRILIGGLMVTSYLVVAADVMAVLECPLLQRTVFMMLAMYAEIVCCACFHCHILALTHHLQRNSRMIQADVILLGLISVIVLSSPWTKWFFYLTKEGEVHRQPLFWMIGLLIVIQFIYDIFCVWFYCRESYLRYKVFCNVLCIAFFGCVLAELFQYPDLEYVSVGLLFVVFAFYLSLQSPDLFIDNATGAYNRNGFFEVLQERIDYGNQVSCLIVRVRNFHSMAQIYGEEVLQIVQKKIRRILEENCGEGVVCHIGASTFAVILEGEEQPEKLYHKVREKILREWKLSEGLVKHEYSYYQVAYPRDCKDYEELIQRIHYSRSDHEAHHKPGELVCLRQDAVEESEDRKKVAHLVEEAVMDNSIEIHFQPIYSIKEGKITSLEVLSRLKDENRKYINPEFFIRVAEENHTIIPLGEQIFRKACIFASENHIFDYGIEDMNINLSPGQCRYEELTDSLVAIAKQYGIPMERMHLEITESEFTDAAAVGRTLKRLKETGAKVALDDFGTGYSTLSNVLELPVDFVKIDKSLVWSFAEGKNQFLNDLMPMIKAEGKRIIAEGIETKEHIEIIEKLQGDFLQGYYFSKPLPGEQFIRFLKDFNEIS